MARPPLQSRCRFLPAPPVPGPREVRRRRLGLREALSPVRTAAMASAAGNTCLGSVYGDCCSLNGYCGNSTDYCGEGCNPLFGKCGGGTNPACEPAPGGTPATVTSYVTRVSTTTQTVTKTVTSTAVSTPNPVLTGTVRNCKSQHRESRLTGRDIIGDDQLLTPLAQ